MPKIKLSQVNIIPQKFNKMYIIYQLYATKDVEKVTMPGKKNVYRLYGNDGHALIDLLQLPSEVPPGVNERVLCRHPFQESKRAWVKPAKVELIYKCFWKGGQIQGELPTLNQVFKAIKNN
jgi:nicotinate phosphoribosyltransferase